MHPVNSNKISSAHSNITDRRLQVAYKATILINFQDSVLQPLRMKERKRLIDTYNANTKHQTNVITQN